MSVNGRFCRRIASAKLNNIDPQAWLAMYCPPAGSLRQAHLRPLPRPLRRATLRGSEDAEHPMIDAARAVLAVANGDHSTKPRIALVRGLEPGRWPHIAFVEGYPLAFGQTLTAIRR